MSTNKYRNIRRNGFDSRKEERRYNELLILERSGIITDLKRQVPYELIPSQRESGKVIERACIYKADFTYIQDGGLVVEDVKPYSKGKFYCTPEFKIKKKLMLERYGIKIKLV